jgi:Mrp family chromosome partitioning ATPase
MMGSSRRIARDTEGLIRRRTVLIASTTALTLTVMVVLDDWASPTRTIVEGLLVGFALGVCIAFVWDRYSGRLRTASDVEAATGLPVLAAVPPIGAGDRHPSPVADDRSDVATQVYRRLASDLALDLRESGASCLLITSPVRRAGRTTTAVNLAARFAANGMQVVLISADARGGRVDQRLGLSPQPGLMEVLDGSSSLDEALQASGRARLDVLAAGAPSDRGAVGYSLDDLARLLDRLAKTVDLVVIEAPPVFGGVETVLLAQEADLVLLAVDVRRGKRADASTAVSYLAHVQDKLVGTIANDPGRRRGVGRTPAAWLSRRGRGVVGAIASALGVLAVTAHRATRSTKGAFTAVGGRGPLKGRRWAGAIAIATAAAIVIATTLWLGYNDGRSDARQGRDKAPDPSASAASSQHDSIDAALGDCRSHWNAQDEPLETAASSMEQWQVHIDAMNQLVAGKITLRQASAFWEKTRVRAGQKVERFFDADSAYTAGEYSCRAPATARHGDPGLVTLSGCRRGITQREEAIQAARVAIETWHHHVVDMNMLRAGKMSSTRAVRLWNKYWRQGAAEVHDYRVQLRQAGHQSCSA